MNLYHKKGQYGFVDKVYVMMIKNCFKNNKKLELENNVFLNIEINLFKMWSKSVKN